jgi:hypothetical protein
MYLHSPVFVAVRVFVPAVVVAWRVYVDLTDMVQGKVHVVCGVVMPCPWCVGAQQSGAAPLFRGRAAASGHVGGRGPPPAGVWSEDFAEFGSVQGTFLLGFCVMLF